MVMYHQSTFAIVGNTLTANADTTKLYIENTSNQELSFEINSLTDEVEMYYRSKKKQDTLTIFHHSPLHLITIRHDSINDFIHNTFVINRGESIYIQQTTTQITAVKRGDTLRNNELALFASMQQKLGNYEGFMVEETSFKRLSPAVRLLKIKNLYGERMLFLEKYSKVNPVGKAFKDRIRKSFYYCQYTDFLTLYTNDTKFKTSYRANKTIADFIRQMEVSDNFYDLTDYANALQAKLLIETPDLKNYNALYQKAKQNFSGNTRNVLLYKMLVYAEKSPQLGSLINDYVKTGTDQMLTNKIVNNYGLGTTIDIKADKSDDINTATLLKLATKQQVQWKDLLENENIKYVDFWASWCVACREEMRNSKEITEEYASKGIEFIYVSVDENVGSWENASKKEGLSTTQSYLLPNPKNSLIAKQFKISSIPRYILIGKDCKIINADAPRLSDPKIRELFDELLRK